MAEKIVFEKIRLTATFIVHLHSIFYARAASQREWIMKHVESAIGKHPGPEVRRLTPHSPSPPLRACCSRAPHARPNPRHLS